MTRWASVGSVVLSEELRFEIAEIADSFVRLAQRVRAPLADSLGTAAGRLEQSLTVANASAYALRDILVRSGSSLPEQDVQFFMSGLRVGVQGVDQWPETAAGKKGAKGSRKPVVLTVGQVLDWIMDVSAPYIAASNRSARLEQVDFLILAEELDRQAQALGGICDEGSRLGFAFRLPGPMRQLEELTFHIKTSAHLARELAQASDHRDKTGGQKNDR